MFTTNAALNFHCKTKHKNFVDADATEQSIIGDNGVVSTATLTKLKSSQLPAKRSNKRKIPKIVYVLPGKLESDSDIESKKPKVGNSNIEIQSITSIPIYVVDK